MTELCHFLILIIIICWIWLIFFHFTLDCTLFLARFVDVLIVVWFRLLIFSFSLSHFSLSSLYFSSIFHSRSCCIWFLTLSSCFPPVFSFHCYDFHWLVFTLLDSDLLDPQSFTIEDGVSRRSCLAFDHFKWKLCVMSWQMLTPNTVWGLGKG